MKVPAILVAAILLSGSVFAGNWNSNKNYLGQEITKVENVYDKRIHKGLGWSGSVKRSLNDKKWGYSVVDGVERFELRNGDCGNDKYHSDCSTGRERSEVSVGKKFGMRDHFSISYSIKFDESYKSVSPSENYIGQMHIQMGGKSTGHAPMTGMEEFEGSVRMMGTELFKVDNNWHDVEWQFDMKNATVKVSIDGELKPESVAYIPDGAKHAYFKYGIYRNRISAYKRAASGSTDINVWDKVELPTQVVYYKNFEYKKL